MRAHPFRTEGGAPTTKPIPTPTRRGTRPGCEYVPAPFAPRAVLLQPNQTQPRTVGAPPRVRMRAHPFRTEGDAPTTKPNPTPTRRSTRPGCEYVPDPFAPRAVLLRGPTTKPHPNADNPPPTPPTPP